MAAVVVEVRRVRMEWGWSLARSRLGSLACLAEKLLVSAAELEVAWTTGALELEWTVPGRMLLVLEQSCCLRFVSSGSDPITLTS